MKRTLLAFALVPLVLAAVLYRDAGAFLAVAYAYALTYLFGIPLFLFLKRRRKETHASYALAGGVSAGVLALVLFQGVISLIALMAAVGALEGLCFSLIRGQERKTA